MKLEEKRQYLIDNGWVRETTDKPPYRDCQSEGPWFTGFWNDPLSTPKHPYGLSGAIHIQSMRDGTNEILRQNSIDYSGTQRSMNGISVHTHGTEYPTIDSGPILADDHVTIEQYKEKTGKRFKMTKDQVERNLTREEAFEEFKGTYKYRKLMENYDNESI